jgi:hypothetical protein
VDERPRADQKHKCRGAKKGQLTGLEVRMANISFCHGRSPAGTLEAEGPREDQKHNSRRTEQQ